MKIGHWPSGVGCRVSGVSSEKARTSLKPMLREGFSTPDNVQKKRPVFLSCYEICSKMNLHIMGSIYTDYIGFWGGLRYPPKEAEMQRLCNQQS